MQAQWPRAQQVCDSILSYIDAAAGNVDDDDIRRFGYDWPDDRVLFPLTLQRKPGFTLSFSCKCT